MLQAATGTKTGMLLLCSGLSRNDRIERGKTLLNDTKHNSHYRTPTESSRYGNFGLSEKTTDSNKFNNSKGNSFKSSYMDNISDKKDDSWSDNQKDSFGKSRDNMYKHVDSLSKREPIFTNERSSARSDSKAGLIGLINIGNTCYMNSTLQCLINSPGFADQVEHTNISSNKSLSSAFKNLINESTGRRAGSTTRPSDIKSAIAKKSHIFHGYGQQDAHEFLIHFLEAVSTELNEVRSKPKYVELDYNPKRTMQQNSDDWFDYYLKHEKSIVIDSFCGQLLSELDCMTPGCKYTSLSFNNFLDLSLSFKDNYKIHEIPDMIREFLKPEEIRDGYCGKEKRQRTCRKTLYASVNSGHYTNFQTS